ncbi:uncharacterized protein LOC135205859 isoform X2 [Macrobrachium nipponense]|uniref:uncharacterized protein LOC135205859 isoform X2 n=1 Tax=Macrobrachium nipponense TaxID=159736 RepID=UPI0030C8098F
MDDSNRKQLKKQSSKTSLEQSLKMISPPQQAPITIYPGPSSSLAALSKADLDLAHRLENLRKSHAEVIPTEEEMASRLAQLKGLPSDHYHKTQNSGASYVKPDGRTQNQKVEDLLEQVMGEVALDEHAPKPEEELEVRLARLRGNDVSSLQAHGAMPLPPHTYQSQSGGDAALSEDLGNISMDEVEAFMHAAEKEASSSAAQAVVDLEADWKLAQAVAQATRKKEKKGSKKKSKGPTGDHDTSDEERHSKSYGSDIDIEGGKAIDAVTEQEEVQRIIDMYTKRAQLKKEKKRKKEEAAAEAGAVGGQDSDSDIEVSSESDLSPESEKFSESDELSD